MRDILNILQEAEQRVNAITPAMVTTAVEQTLAEYIKSGKVKCAYDIGDGHCRSFAWDVLAKLGIGPSNEGEGGIRTLATQDFWSSDDRMNLARLRKRGEPVPNDIPARELSELLGGADHEWIFFKRMHYDAMAPQGVRYILELPFFAKQIEGLRDELRSRR